jgi:hypothetical protein
MPDSPKSLCDLVELWAAKNHIPLARAWKRVFAAIRDGKLDFGFPDEFKAEYGGRNPPQRYVNYIRETQCVNALFAIENGDAFPPWTQLWVQRMLVSEAAFDETFPEPQPAVVGGLHGLGSVRRGIEQDLGSQAGATVSTAGPTRPLTEKLADQFTAKYITEARASKRHPTMRALEAAARKAGYRGGREYLRAAYSRRLPASRGRPRKPPS